MMLKLGSVVSEVQRKSAATVRESALAMKSEMPYQPALLSFGERPLWVPKRAGKTATQRRHKQRNNLQ